MRYEYLSYLSETLKDEDGNALRVYKDSDGNEIVAPNGMYDTSDGSIHIDLNAGENGEGTALFTLGHELTHFIKYWSEKKFKVLADFLIAEYGKTNKTMHERVVEKQNWMTANRGEDVSYDEAFEEVVADAMSTMLSDGNLHEKLAKLKAKDTGLFNKIKQFFDKMIAKFQAVYKNLTPEQQSARDVRDMKDAFDRIQQAFAEALVEASDNFQAATEQKNTTEDGGVKMSIRENVVDVNGRVYKKVVKPGLTVYDKVKHSKKTMCPICIRRYSKGHSIYPLMTALILRLNLPRTTKG